MFKKIGEHPYPISLDDHLLSGEWSIHDRKLHYTETDTPDLSVRLDRAIKSLQCLVPMKTLFYCPDKHPNLNLIRLHCHMILNGMNGMKCKDCGTCDHYVNCVLDEVYFRIFYPTYLLCGTCDNSVPGRKRYLFTDDMKTTYRDGGTKCLACRSERTWPPHKRVCKSCYLRQNVQQKL